MVILESDQCGLAMAAPERITSSAARSASCSKESFGSPVRSPLESALALNACIDSGFLASAA
jgi:hypothetical protein